MKKLIFCCLCVLAMMACGERNAVQGRWAMELDGSYDTAFLMTNDTICSPELYFEYDTVYMEIKTDGKTVNRDFMGVYDIHNDRIRIVSREGMERTCKFTVEDNIMTVTDIDDPDKIVMRLRRIKESG